MYSGIFITLVSASLQPCSPIRKIDADKRLNCFLIGVLPCHLASGKGLQGNSRQSKLNSSGENFTTQKDLGVCRIRTKR